MVDLCLFFRVSEFNRLNNYRVYDIGKNQNYFDEKFIEDTISQTGYDVYINLNNYLAELFDKHQDKFKIVFSINGITLEHMKKYAPFVLDSFVQLVKRGNVEFVLEPYYNSLSSIYSKDEFEYQIVKQNEAIKDFFGVEPKIFRDSGFVFSNDLVDLYSQLGIKEVILSSNKKLSSNENENFVFGSSKGDLKLLFENKQFSNELLNLKDIVSVSNLADRVVNDDGQIVSLFVDYKQLGDSNLEYFGDFVSKIINEGSCFIFPTQIMSNVSIVEQIDVPNLISSHKSSSVKHILGNRLQESAQEKLYEIEKMLKDHNDENILENWRRLSSIKNCFWMNVDDHFTGELDNYFENPYDAYVYFMNALNDIVLRVRLKEEKIRFEEMLAKKDEEKIEVDELKNLIYE